MLDTLKEYFMTRKYLNRFMYDKDKYHVLIYYFTYMLANKYFIDRLTLMSEDKSASSEAIGYSFASECDEEDIENGEYFEEGVYFFWGYGEYDEIIVDYTMFYNSLKLACDIYIESYPDKRDVITSKLKIIKERYNL